uniref:KATNIP domain-containing protein n=1 Tax=Guillardia theta TaxID=55529 RepID=A0A7S4UKN9_GUITH
MDESVLCAIEQHDANDINMNPQTTEVHVEESNLKDLERPKTASGRKNEAKQEQGHGMKEQVLPSETESVEISGPTKRLPPQVVVTESGDIEEEEMIVTPPIPSRIAQDGSDPFMRMDRRPLGLDGRPMTGMVEMGKLQGNSSSFPSSFSSDLLPSSPTTISGRNLTLVLHSNWGDSETLGLCGLDIILQDDSKLRVNASMILVTCEGADGGHEAACLDSTYAASLFMGPHELKGEEEMWVVPHYPYVKYRINIDMGEPRLLKHFCVWNYNGSIENTYRGVKRMSIVLDNRSLSPPAGHLVRKAPGPTRISIDFSQKICLTSLGERIGTPQIFRGSSSIITPEGYVMQEYEPPTLPSGFIFKFSLISTWDDRFYIGLNGIQLYDQFDNLVPVHPRNLKVVCTEGVTSIAELPDCVGDPRTAEKIIDGVNDTNDESHMWLAPFRRGETNNIFFMFDEPITLSLIKIWNYRKTVGRGVKEFLLSIDDTLVYKGHLRRATAAGEDSWQSILFTHDRHIVSRERGHVYVHFQEEPDELLFFDDAEEQEKVEEQESRPRTSFLPSK